MEEKESIMVVRCELKIPSLRITVRHHLASLKIPNSYPGDGIFNPHLTTIKGSYNLTGFVRLELAVRKQADKEKAELGLSPEGTPDHFLISAKNINLKNISLWNGQYSILGQK